MVVIQVADEGFVLGLLGLHRLVAVVPTRAPVSVDSCALFKARVRYLNAEAVTNYVKPKYCLK